MIRSTLACAVAAVVMVACAPDSTAPTPPTSATRSTLAGLGGTNPNGIGGAEPAYYDGELFTINLKELPAGGESAALAHNRNFNIIYETEGCSAGGEADEFVDVIDAVPGDGFNPLWREVEIEFANPGDCRQFTSDEEIQEAADAGIITLEPTSELYRCSVIGAPNVDEGD